jgi:hypothetical protein
MTNKKLWLGMLAVALVFGMTVVGCEGEPDDPVVNPPTTKDPLTGTVTVSSNVAVNTINGLETMTLTANTSGLNVTNPIQSSFSYQWIRDGSDISNARGQTYDVTAADYGKTLQVRVTYPAFSGEQVGQLAVQSPTICTISVKYNSTTTSANRKRVIFERTNGTSFGGNTSTSLGTTAETVTLTSWSATKFKMRIDFTFGIAPNETKYYFKKVGTADEEFDLTNGTKSYILAFDYSTSALGNYSNLTATED